MEAAYCVLCQEAHQMSSSCLLNVQCKRCGKTGHLRIDCSGHVSTKVEVTNGYNPLLNQLRDSSDRQGSIMSTSDTYGLEIPGQVGVKTERAWAKSNNTKNLTNKERNQIVKECVEDLISPTMLANKWQCYPDTIRTWVRKAGKQLPKQYKSMYPPETPSISVKQEDCENSSGHEVKQITKHGIKRKSSTLVSTCPSQSDKSMSETVLRTGDDPSIVLLNSQTHIKHEPEPSVELSKLSGYEYFEYDSKAILKSEYGSEPKESTTRSLIPELKVDLDVSREVNDVLKMKVENEVARLPKVSDFWQIGKPTKNEGTVYCPVCTAGVRFSNIFKHLDNSHPYTVYRLHCLFCKSLVSPSDVSLHMPKCSGQVGVKTERAWAKSNNTNNLTNEERNQIVKECVKDLISPTMLANKWQCNPDTIRTWVRKAGKQLPKQYKSMYLPETQSISVKQEDCENSSGHEV